MWDPAWEKVFSSQPWGKYPAEELIRFVARNFYGAARRSEMRILEIGCGPGGNLWYLAREGFGFAGIDGSPTAIRQAEERLDAECPGWRERGELRVGDISQLPFPDGTFDAVIDSEAVYANDYAAAQAMYREARRVLRTGGKLFARTFATGCWGDETGEKVGHNAWLCGEGPMAGKGLTRFTAGPEIPVLLDGFEAISTELLTRTMDEGKYVIKEWIVTATKPV